MIYFINTDTERDVRGPGQISTDFHPMDRRPLTCENPRNCIGGLGTQTCPRNRVREMNQGYLKAA